MFNALHSDERGWPTTDSFVMNPSQEWPRSFKSGSGKSLGSDEKFPSVDKLTKVKSTNKKELKTN